jgi:cell division protein FtsX
MSKLNRAWVGAGALVVSFATMASAALATGPTYDIAPVTTSVTSELAANLPTILLIIGALIALAIAVRFVKRHAKPS